MRTEKKQSSKKIKGFQLDVLLSLILIIVGITCVYMAFSFTMIPRLWVYFATALIFVIIAILTLLIFIRRQRAWIITTRRIITLLLVITLVITAFFISSAKSGISDISNNSTKTPISIIVKDDAKYKNVKDLKNKKVGIQVGLDKKNAQYAQDKLDNEVNVKYVEESDYASLGQLLMDGEIEAIIISDSQITSITDHVSDFPSYRKLTTYVKEKENTASGSDKDLTKETFTVYVSGLDDPGDPTQNLGSDVNMLLIIDPIANRIQSISFPRDAYVPNAGADFENDKLTHTGRYGIDATVDSMEQFLGIKVDYYAKISFTSLIEVVDILGGITVDVPIDFEEQDENRSFEEEDLIRLKKGVQELDGREALALSRHRHSYIDQDISRNKNQQLVMNAIMKKLVSAKGVSVADELFKALPDIVMTNMSTEQISSFSSTELESLKPWTLSSITLSSGGNDLMITASIPGFPVDCYLFTRDEIRVVKEAYDGAMNRLQMNTFEFDLQELHTIEIPGDQDSNMVFYE